MHVFPIPVTYMVLVFPVRTPAPELTRKHLRAPPQSTHKIQNFLGGMPQTP